MSQEKAEREVRFVSIPEGLHQERVDAALSRLLGLSRSTIVTLIENNEVSRKGKSLTKSDRVNTDDYLEITMPAIAGEAKLTATPIDDFKVVYDDSDVIVIDKPAGVAAHPSPGWRGPTVIGGVIAAGYQVSTSGAAERQGVVHRLDVGTTGLMVIAKNENSYSNLKQQFRDRTVTKVYHALVQGHMDPTEGTIDAPIDRHPKIDHRFAVVADGKESITHYELIEYYRSVSMIKVELETGRTHQIRVHFSALNHPLVGDTTYGADPVLAKSLAMARPWLHAKELRFTHPITEEQMEFKADYPDDLQACLALLSDAVIP